jgi:hypothetical protein
MADLLDNDKHSEFIKIHKASDFCVGGAMFDSVPQNVYPD